MEPGGAGGARWSTWSELGQRTGDHGHGYGGEQHCLRPTQLIIGMRVRSTADVRTCTLSCVAPGCGWFWYDVLRAEVVHATSSYSQSERLAMSDLVYRPCSACHGDCDSDADCEAGLICFQRDGTEAVPGCTDPADYCYNPLLLWCSSNPECEVQWGGSFNQTSAVTDCPVGVTGQAAHTTHSHHGSSRRVASTIEFAPFCEVTGCDYETKMRQGV